jgi:hypothetical protein
MRSAKSADLRKRLISLGLAARISLLLTSIFVEGEMQRYEYKVVPSPRKGEKSRSARTTPDRFALALTTLMNKLGQDGWEYLRADALPCDERAGLTGTKTTYQNMLVFRRQLDAVDASPLILPAADEVTQFKPVLGAAEAPVGSAPALGPANPGLAAE